MGCFGQSLLQRAAGSHPGVRGALGPLGFPLRGLRGGVMGGLVGLGGGVLFP